MDVLHDNDDEFKEYQREFRKLGAEVAQSKLLEELSLVEDERDVYQKAYDEEKNKFDANGDKLDSLNNLLIDVKGIFL